MPRPVPGTRRGSVARAGRVHPAVLRRCRTDRRDEAARHALAHAERLPLCLGHIDAHADAVDGFLPDPAGWAALQGETDVARIYERVAQDSDITLASFIAPAIRRGWITAVHFFGCADDDDLLDAPLLAAAGASQQ